MKEHNVFEWTDLRFVEDTPDKMARHVISKRGMARSERKVYIERIHDADTYLARGSGYKGVVEMLKVDVLGDNDTYRVSVFPDGVDVMCFGLADVDSQVEGHYDRPDDLPRWVQERLAVLSMIPPTPPTPFVDGVGRRISVHVYWVCAPVAQTDASTSA
jgi:hypothetical protein